MVSENVPAKTPPPAADAPAATDTAPAAGATSTASVTPNTAAAAPAGTNPSADRAPNDEWWRGGVIYQIYPRSYQDTTGDGIGDLNGITRRLDHVARLGVDAIWLSPFFRSPMKDFGYDVSDYRDVDPMFGTLDDFSALVARAHELGLKVMIDQVISHTSDQHPWFVESRKNRCNPRADWYVWADPKYDGTPPTNWLSVFGGSAWQFDTGRMQYYLHNFLTSQPDLNLHNPQVQDQLLSDIRFWLELGVDGFRLDTVNFYFHDRGLHDNPGKGPPVVEDPSVSVGNPYAWQRHQYDKTQPENIPFLKRIRALLDEYPNTTMVGEVGDDDSLKVIADYTGGGDKLHMAYSFDLLGREHSAPGLHRLFDRFIQQVGDGWPSWALSNHDVKRVGSRWGAWEAEAAPSVEGLSCDICGPNGGVHTGGHGSSHASSHGTSQGAARNAQIRAWDAAMARNTPPSDLTPNMALLKLAAVLQMTMRGSPCLYQGDELGLPEAELRFEQLQDPYGKTMWPKFKGRDGCRTPFP